MKRVILDEGVPKKIVRNLPGHEVTTVPAEGWAGTRNGKLLSLIERARFDVFVTADKNMEYQQPVLERRPFAVLLLSTNHLPLRSARRQNSRGAGRGRTRIAHQGGLRNVPAAPDEEAWDAIAVKS